jgi:hypothetical protein
MIGCGQSAVWPADVAASIAQTLESLLDLKLALITGNKFALTLSLFALRKVWISTELNALE